MFSTKRVYDFGPVPYEKRVCVRNEPAPAQKKEISDTVDWYPTNWEALLHWLASDPQQVYTKSQVMALLTHTHYSIDPYQSTYLN